MATRFNNREHELGEGEMQTRLATNITIKLKQGKGGFAENRDGFWRLRRRGGLVFYRIEGKDRAGFVCAGFCFH